MSGAVSPGDPRPSLVRQNAEKNPSYAPYCMGCRTMTRMRIRERFLWQCEKCFAIHDERDPSPVSESPTAPEYSAVELACRGCMGPCGECGSPVTFEEVMDFMQIAGVVLVSVSGRDVTRDDVCRAIEHWYVRGKTKPAGLRPSDGDVNDIELGGEKWIRARHVDAELHTTRREAFLAAANVAGVVRDEYVARTKEEGLSPTQRERYGYAASIARQVKGEILAHAGIQEWPAPKPQGIAPASHADATSQERMLDATLTSPDRGAEGPPLRRMADCDCEGCTDSSLCQCCEERSYLANKRAKPRRQRRNAGGAR